MSNFGVVMTISPYILLLNVYDVVIFNKDSEELWKERFVPKSL